MTEVMKEERIVYVRDSYHILDAAKNFRRNRTNLCKIPVDETTPRGHVILFNFDQS